MLCKSTSRGPRCVGCNQFACRSSDAAFTRPHFYATTATAEEWWQCRRAWSSWPSFLVFLHIFVLSKNGEHGGGGGSGSGGQRCLFSTPPPAAARAVSTPSTLQSGSFISGFTVIAFSGATAAAATTKSTTTSGPIASPAAHGTTAAAAADSSSAISLLQCQIGKFNPSDAKFKFRRSWSIGSKSCRFGNGVVAFFFFFITGDARK